MHGQDVSDAESQLEICIAIPTFERVALLNDALRETAGQIAGVTTRFNCEASLLVIDNDPAGSAESIAVRHGARYFVEPEPGIAAVRNRALRESTAFDAIVFLDDDEVPQSGWLEALVSRYLEDRPDAVAGKVLTPFPEYTPNWVRASGAFIRPTRADRQIMGEAATNNLLLDLRSVRASGIQFDERFGLSGGSDSLFTRQFVQWGARIVWAENAVVVEREESSRFTREWVLRRTFRFGNTRSRVALALSPSGGRRVVTRLWLVTLGLARVLVGYALFGVGAFTNSLPRRARAERTVARGRGMVAGAFGHVHNEYGLRRGLGASGGQ